MGSKFQDAVTALGAKYIGQVPDVGGGAFGAAQLARILEERLEPGRGKRPGRPTDQRWTYRHRHIPMTEETLQKLDTLVERVNQHAEKRLSRSQVAAVLLEQAITREL